MATIIVVVHEHDRLTRGGSFCRPATDNYLLVGVLGAMERRGHRWRVSYGPQLRGGDVGILHVDRTVVPAEYLALARHYPTAVNFAAADISKRRVSGALLARGEPWRGPVIVKTDLNFSGRPEALHNARAVAAGRPAPDPHLAPPGDYVILASPDDVPGATWDDPGLVVERFIPEADPHGHAVRSWTFFGPRERCTRRISADPMVKATNSRRGDAAVPEALRAERARLGFDYGKFDFVLEAGRAILLDANRTPGAPPGSPAALRPRAELLATGLEELMRRRR